MVRPDLLSDIINFESRVSAKTSFKATHLRVCISCSQWCDTYRAYRAPSVISWTPDIRGSQVLKETPENPQNGPKGIDRNCGYHSSYFYQPGASNGVKTILNLVYTRTFMVFDVIICIYHNIFRLKNGSCFKTVQQRDPDSLEKQDKCPTNARFPRKKKKEQTQKNSLDVKRTNPKKQHLLSLKIADHHSTGCFRAACPTYFKLPNNSSCAEGPNRSY